MPKAALAFLAITGAILVSTLIRAQNDSGRSPQTVKEVMTTMTIPGSDVIFGAASDPPQDEAAWMALREGARLLADSGRLLMTPELARDSSAWMERARELVTEAEATRRLAEQKNREGLEAASDRVYASCEACHKRYMQP